jgi:pimeloyl-ACP methyl ester carboxylesterase
MAPYESMSWPSGMMFPFVSCALILNNLFTSFSSSTTAPPKAKKYTPLLVISGAQDILMKTPLMKRMANMYAATNVGIGYSTSFKNVSSLQYEFTSGVPSERSEGDGREKVWFAEITAPGAGHNLMRDDGWERCARVLEAFLDE